MYIYVRCLHWGIYTGTLITVARMVSLFPSSTWGQVPCPVRGEGCVVMQPPHTGLLWARISHVTALICTSYPLVPATGMKPSLQLPPPPVWLMHELPVLSGKGVNQSVGGEDANSSTAVWWGTGICVPWKSVLG